MKPILIIEDEHALASALAAVCQRLGHAARTCYSAKRGLEAAAAGEFSLAILDIGLPDRNGLEVLEELRALWPALPVIIITAHGNLENAVAARKLRATEYLVKPLDLHEVQETLRSALAAPRPPGVKPPAASLLVGAAPALQQTFVEIAHACASDAPVLLTGPTGSGKTLAARVIHLNSARAAGPFISLSCHSLSEPILESQLFGSELHFSAPGTAPGGPGLIERAEGGTLFLDEIADIPLQAQGKLLRFVEERAISRAGAREEVRVDCRLLTATGKELREEVRAGRFREDLYYRLRVLEVTLPALRQRRGDIPALARFFLGQLAPGRTLALAPEALRLLEQHDWPGNIRELRHALEHAAAVAPGDLIAPPHLPRELARARRRAPGAPLRPALHHWIDQRLEAGANFAELELQLEALLLEDLLPRYGNKPTVMARALEMNRVTLRRKCRRLPGQSQSSPADPLEP